MLNTIDVRAHPSEASRNCRARPSPSRPGSHAEHHRCSGTHPSEASRNCRASFTIPSGSHAEHHRCSGTHPSSTECSGAFTIPSGIRREHACSGTRPSEASRNCRARPSPSRPDLMLNTIDVRAHIRRRRRVARAKVVVLVARPAAFRPREVPRLTEGGVVRDRQGDELPSRPAPRGRASPCRRSSGQLSIPTSRLDVARCRARDRERNDACAHDEPKAPHPSLIPESHLHPLPGDPVLLGRVSWHSVASHVMPPQGDGCPSNEGFRPPPGLASREWDGAEAPSTPGRRAGLPSP